MVYLRTFASRRLHQLYRARRVQRRHSKRKGDRRDVRSNSMECMCPHVSTVAGRSQSRHHTTAVERRVQLQVHSPPAMAWLIWNAREHDITLNQSFPSQPEPSRTHAPHGILQSTTLLDEVSLGLLRVPSTPQSPHLPPTRDVRKQR